MEKFQNKDGSNIITGLISTIQKNKQFLSDIDGKIGDGDHGVNMNKGFTLCGEKIKEKSGDLTYSFSTLSETLMSNIGGSMGPLYGMFFRAMAKGCKDKDSINSEDFRIMLTGAKESVQKISEAKVGDKTLMDVLIPAADEYDQALQKGKSFSEALQYMIAAAKKGRDSTIDMIAKLGRSSRLGERSRGVMDAGAASCYLILESITESILKLLRE